MPLPNKAEFYLNLSETFTMADQINSIDFSRDGEICASACNNYINTYSVRKGEKLDVIECKKDGVQKVQYLNDNSKLCHLTTGDQKFVKIVDLEKGVYLSEYKVNEDNFDSLAINHYRNQFVTTSYRKLVHIWDERTPMPEAEIEICERGVVACHPDGYLLAVANIFGTFIYDIRSVCKGALMACFHTDLFDEDCNITFSPNGMHLAVACLHFVQLYNTTYIAPLCKFTEFKTTCAMVLETCFNHDSSLVLSGSADGTVRMFDIKEKKPVHSLAVEDRSLNHVQCVKANNKYMLVASAAGSELYFWQLNSNFMDQFKQGEIVGEGDGDGDAAATSTSATYATSATSATSATATSAEVPIPATIEYTNSEFTANSHDVLDSTD